MWQFNGRSGKFRVCGPRRGALTTIKKTPPPLFPLTPSVPESRGGSSSNSCACVAIWVRIKPSHLSPPPFSPHRALSLSFSLFLSLLDSVLNAAPFEVRFRVCKRLPFLIGCGGLVLIALSIHFDRILEIVGRKMRFFFFVSDTLYRSYGYVGFGEFQRFIRFESLTFLLDLLLQYDFSKSPFVIDRAFVDFNPVLGLWFDSRMEAFRVEELLVLIYGIWFCILMAILKLKIWKF